MKFLCSSCKQETLHQAVFAPASGPKKRSAIIFKGEYVRCLECRATYLLYLNFGGLEELAKKIGV